MDSRLEAVEAPINRTGGAMNQECIDCAPRHTPATHEYEYLTVLVPLCPMHWSHWLSADRGLIDESLPQTVVKANIVKRVAESGIAQFEEMLRGAS